MNYDLGDNLLHVNIYWGWGSHIDFFIFNTFYDGKADVMNRIMFGSNLNTSMFI